MWQYETGKYAGNGDFTITQKPKNTLLNYYDIVYNSRSALGSYTASQYYLPKAKNIFSGITSSGPIIRVDFNSPGPM